MKTKQNVTVFQCEHCGRKMFRKHSMEHHEKYCSSNPENFAACSGCDNLEETTVLVESKYSEDGTRDNKAFRCKATGKLLYPVKALRKGLPTKYPETFEGQELMPNKCEHRQSPEDLIFN